MKISECCNYKIEENMGGVGVFSLTTGSFICTHCRKYCVAKRHKPYCPVLGGAKECKNCGEQNYDGEFCSML